MVYRGWSDNVYDPETLQTLAAGCNFAARSRITMRFRPIEALNKMGVNRSWLDSCAKHEKKASFMLKLLYMKRK